MNDLSSILQKRFPAPTGDFPACFAFSIHKAGSTMMHKMIGEVCVAAKIPAMTIPDLLFQEGIFEKDWAKDASLLPWIRDGLIYYGFRNLPEILLDPQVRLRSRKCVLLVRDPRDALVSQYYSFGGKHVSHQLPSKNADKFLSRMDQTKHLEIDEYVLVAARNHLQKLRAYRENLDFSTVLLRRYEDVFFDKAGFITGIFSHFGIPVDPEVLKRVAAANDIRPAQEAVGRHIRKGTPGDHRDKLQPATIAGLNDIFREVCREYGYELDA